MKYTRLGNSGLRISPIVLGCMSYGLKSWEPWVLEEDEALPVMKAAFDAGINTLDTANGYSHGYSEKLIQRFMEKYKVPRHHLVIMTKVFFGVSEDQNDSSWFPLFQRDAQPAYSNTTGLSRSAIFHQAEASLKELGTDYIDLLWIHRADHQVPKEETMAALHSLVQSGKVRYIGASSMFAWELAEYQHVAEKNGWTKFVAMQNSYSALYREEEREMIPYCKQAGLGLVPWFALSSSRLTKPLSRQVEISRPTWNERFTNDLSEADESIINRVEEIAKKKGLSMAQVAFLWVARQVDAPLLGINKIERVDEFVQALEHSLTEEEASYIAEPYKPQAIMYNLPAV